MILEVAMLDIIPAKEVEFEANFSKAQHIIAGMHGYLGHELQRCLERPSRYVLLVQWETLEDHTQGFRQSLAYAEWKSLLHHFYDPFPTVEHYAKVF